MLRNEIVLVDEQDNMTGIAAKEEAHKKPLLHRAFSVFLYDGRQMLVQQRAFSKYHSGGLWANTCCSHPRPNEETVAAGESRLLEEAGIRCNLREAFTFTYCHQFSEELYEHEFDHVLLGEYDVKSTFRPNPEEIAQMKWISFDTLLRGLEENPEQYAPWFRIAAPRVIELLNGKTRQGQGSEG